MATELDRDDAADMRALCSGEELALNRLMLRHREKLFHYLIRQLQDESEAMDLAQETFVRVFLNREKFKPANRFSTWLYAIATNLARDRMRWLGRHRLAGLISSRADEDRNQTSRANIHGETSFTTGDLQNNSRLLRTRYYLDPAAVNFSAGTYPGGSYFGPWTFTDSVTGQPFPNGPQIKIT